MGGGEDFTETKSNHHLRQNLNTVTFSQHASPIYKGFEQLHRL